MTPYSVQNGSVVTVKVIADSSHAHGGFPIETPAKPMASFHNMVKLLSSKQLFLGQSCLIQDLVKDLFSPGATGPDFMPSSPDKFGPF
jgi:hypothetical protein